MNIFSANEQAADLLLQGNNLEAGQSFLQALSELRKEVEASEYDDALEECDLDTLRDLNELKKELFTVPLRSQVLNHYAKDNDKCTLEFFQSMFLELYTKQCYSLAGLSHNRKRLTWGLSLFNLKSICYI